MPKRMNTHSLLNADARSKIFAPWDLAIVVDEEFDDISREEELDLQRQTRMQSALVNWSY